MRRDTRSILDTVLRVLGVTGLMALAALPAGATNPGPPNVSSLFVPLEGQVTLSNGDVVSFAGEVHVLTRARVDDQGVGSMSLYVNLARVQEIGTSGMAYVLGGAASLDGVEVNPGPPNTPEQTFEFTLVSLATPPNPILPPSPIVPVLLRNFSFCVESNCAPGSLQSVEASFVSD